MIKTFVGKNLNEVSKQLCLRSKVIPVLSVNETDDALPLAEALVEGGLPVLEVTLRTPNALSVVKEMSKITDATIGVGTLLKWNDVIDAVEAGAKFGVSPGVTDELLQACEQYGLPLIGGVSTVSEIMKMLDRGYSFLKFFPAEASGGVSKLEALKAPLPEVEFCPTGGISEKNADQYLRLKNVICVGGSWMASSKLIFEKNWKEITKKAKFASAMD